MKRLLLGVRRKLKIGIFGLCVILNGCNEIDVPVVSIVTPQPDSHLNENFKVEVSATAEEGIHKVELFLNNVFVGRADAVPFDFMVNIAGYTTGDYVLKAVAFGNSGVTAETEIAIIIANATLPIPLEFSATKGRYGNKILLEWNESPGATQYEIFKMNESLQFVKIATAPGKQFEDQTIGSPLTQYFYKIRAFNSDTQFSEFSAVDYGYTSGESYDMITSFGREGTAEDEFGMVVHLSYYNNELFLADDYRNRLVVYSKEGSFKRVDRTYNSYPIAPYFFGNKLLNVFGNTISVEEGSNTISAFTADLIGMRQTTVDDENYIYVAASNSNKITKFDMQGNLIKQWGEAGDSPGQFNGSWGIAFYHDNIVVSNYFSKKVQFFSKNGEFIKEWVFGDGSGTFDLYAKDDFLYIACGPYVAKTDYQGAVIEKIYGQFEMATGIAVDEDNNIFITSPYERKIYVYAKSL